MTNSDNEKSDTCEELLTEVSPNTGVLPKEGRLERIVEDIERNWNAVLDDWFEPFSEGDENDG